MMVVRNANQAMSCHAQQIVEKVFKFAAMITLGFHAMPQQIAVARLEKQNQSPAATADFKNITAPLKRFGSNQDSARAKEAAHPVK